MIQNYLALYLSDSMNVAFLNTGLEKNPMNNIFWLCQHHELPFTTYEGKDIYSEYCFSIQILRLESVCS